VTIGARNSFDLSVSGSVLQFKLPLSGRDVRVPFDVSPVSLCILPDRSVIDTGLAYYTSNAGRFKVKLKTFGVGRTPTSISFEPKFNCFLFAAAQIEMKKYDKKILAACHKHLYRSFVNGLASGEAKNKKTQRRTSSS